MLSLTSWFNTHVEMSVRSTYIGILIGTLIWSSQQYNLNPDSMRLATLIVKETIQPKTSADDCRPRYVVYLSRPFTQEPCGPEAWKQH